MSLKNAAFLALAGMTLVTILLMAVLIGDALAFVRGLIPVMRLLTSLIYAFASLSVLVFPLRFSQSSGLNVAANAVR
jgi:hypothetical protein